MFIVDFPVILGDIDVMLLACRLVTHCSGTMQILCQSSIRVELSRRCWHHVSLTYNELTSTNHTEVMVSYTDLLYMSHYSLTVHSIIAAILLTVSRVDWSNYDLSSSEMTWSDIVAVILGFQVDSFYY